MKYVVNVEIGRKPYECVYNAVVPELPGCFTTAMTFEELEANLREAVELWLEGAAAGGDHSHPAPTGFVLHFEHVEIAV